MLVWIILVIFGVALLAGAGVFGLERLVPAKRRASHNDVFGFVYAVVGVAYAVLLGLIVIAAWNTLDEATTNTYAETDALLQLYWYGHSLPQPQGTEVEHLVKEYTTLVINIEWPELAHQQSSPQAWRVSVQLRNSVQAQQPTGPAAVVRYQQALDATAQLSDARRERIDQSSQGIPSLLWAALALGGIVTVGFAYFFGMKSTVAHAIVMFSLTLIFACLLLVIYELNYPFSGIVKVNPDAFKLALELMQQIP
jgi:Protein of unknown function (DUF4239)